MTTLALSRALPTPTVKPPTVLVWLVTPRAVHALAPLPTIARLVRRPTSWRCSTPRVWPLAPTTLSPTLAPELAVRAILIVLLATDLWRTTV